MSKPKHSPGTVFECVYDGYATIFVNGHVDEATAARAAEEFVLGERMEAAGAWYDEVWPEDRWAMPPLTEPRPTGVVLRCVRCDVSHPAVFEARKNWDWWATVKPDACPACGAECAEDVPRPRYGFGCVVVERDGVLAPVQVWGRWGFAGSQSDHERELHVHHGPRRGSFKLTIVRDLDVRDREVAEDAAAQAERDAAVVKARDRWPASTNHYPRRRGPEGVDVSFNLPGLAGVVTWYTGDPGHVMVEQRDLAAWTDLYAARPGEDSPG